MLEGINLKRVASFVGNALMVVSLFFIVRAFVTMKIDYSFFMTPQVILGSIAFSLLYAAMVYLTTYSWKCILAFLSGQRVSYFEAAKVYTKANLGKYLPGNIMHFVERNAFGVNLGLSQAQIALSSVVEVLLILLTCAVWSLLLAGKTTITLLWGYLAQVEMQTILAGGLLLLLLVFAFMFFVLRKQKNAVASLRKLWGPHFFALLATLFVLYSISQAGAAAALVAILSWSIPLTIGNTTLIISAYIISWLIGFMVPGAPGGIGIREAVLMLMLQGVCSQEILILAVVLQRMISILGDVLAWVFNLIWQRYRHKKEHEIF